MQFTKNEIVKHLQTNPVIGSMVFGFGATNIAFAHGLQSAHDMDLQILYTSRTKGLLKPLNAKIFKDLKRDPQAVLGKAMETERKRLTAEGQRILANQIGNKDGWKRTAVNTRRLLNKSPLPIEILKDIKRDQREQNLLAAGKLRTLWRDELASLPETPIKKSLKSKFFNLAEDERILHEIANPSLAHRIFSPRNFKISGVMLAVAGLSLAIYEGYNAYNEKKA